MTWWLGDVADIDYRDDSAEGGVEADCVLRCRMASGAAGRIELSRTRALRDTIRIDGTKGFVEVHLAKNEVIAGSPNALAFAHDGRDVERRWSPSSYPSCWTPNCAISRTASPAPRAGISGRDGLKSVELIERCYKARQPMQLPWVGVSQPKTNGVHGPRPTVPAGSKVLITGATGFIGGRLAEILIEQGADVRCAVRNFGHATRLARLGPTIIRADLTNGEQMDEAIEGVDYVFHCAHDMRSVSTNMKGLENIIEACVRHKAKRLVYVSTVSVYEPFPDGLLSEKTRDGDRGWMYTRTKLDMEARVLKAVREQGLAGTIVQPTIVYGPYSKPWTNAPAENLIYGTVVLPDRGEGLCNAVYIDDLVDGFILAATQPGAVGERFLLSGPAPVGWGEFFGAMARALGTAQPEFWPNERISKMNHGIMRHIKRVARNPKRILQIIVRWNPARQALQAGIDKLPEPLKGLMMKHSSSSGGRKPGEVIIPHPQQLKLYMAKAYSDNAKAERLLGYHPRYDFASGMEPTGLYLKWAYGDLQRSVAAKKPGVKPESVNARLDAAHAE